MTYYVPIEVPVCSYCYEGGGRQVFSMILRCYFCGEEIRNQ